MATTRHKTTVVPTVFSSNEDRNPQPFPSPSQPSNMCNTYTFYHICGHTYLRTLISCTAAVDRAATANLSSPRRIPLPCSAPLSPPSPYTNTSRTSSPPHTPLLTPPLPLPVPFPSPTAPSATHLRSIHACSQTPDAVSIVPSNCAPCTALNSLQTSLAASSEDRAAVKLVSAVRKAELQRPELGGGSARRRARSEVASPDTVSPVEAWAGAGVGVESLELLRPVRFDASKKVEEGEAGSGWGSAWRGKGREGGVLAGHSVTASRRRGVDAKARIASARKRVVSGFGAGW